MPVVHPAEVWKESGRYHKIGPELVRFKDRGERDMVLAMTHEEVVALLLRDIVQSYRQLPMIVYHFQTKFRDEPRSRGGLIRVREFVMKDSYSLRPRRRRPRRELPASTTPPTRGSSSGSGSTRSRSGRRRDHGRHRRPRVHGPQRVRRGHARPVRRCGFADNQQIAIVGKPDPEPEARLPMEDVETPGATTIEALATSSASRRRRPRRPRSS